MSSSPIARWHHMVAENDLSALDAMLAEDAVFKSPAVHRPQAGRALVAKYLRAAMVVLNRPGFRYVDTWEKDGSAILEFALAIDGVEIEGIDMIRWNADGEITDFTVMMRPLKGLNTVIPLMAALLADGAVAVPAGTG